MSPKILSIDTRLDKTSTLWSTLSVILAFFQLGKDANVNSVKKTTESTPEAKEETTKSYGLLIVYMAVQLDENNDK